MMTMQLKYKTRFKFALSIFAASMTALPGVGFSQAALPAQTTPPRQTAPQDALAPSEMQPYQPPANVLVPESSKSVPADAGVRGHTNMLMRKPDGATVTPLPDQGRSPPESAPNR